ncbi:MAG TPA: hypothetical protein VFK38_03575 [Candidatus Limnocylindrales bacterium]|nr:hypothetical protein [Candidatus Limnocylindrales bacterium]
MTSTDQRTGFRLPWTGAPEQAEEAAEAVVDAATMAEPQAEPQAESQAESQAEWQAEPVATTDLADAATTASEGTAMTHEPTTNPPGTRRPARFLADLLRAMQAAASESRAATIESFRAEVSQVVEKVHARSADEANALRDAAEADVAGVREWSKAEIARIRAETEERITARKEELERQLEAHAAAVEAEIERVHGAVSSFEQEMDAFFSQLTAIDDPTVFAATAERLPEPPSLESAVAQLAPIEQPVTDPGDQSAESWPEPTIPAEAAWPSNDVADTPEQPAGEPAPTAAAEWSDEPRREVVVAAAADADADVADEPDGVVDDADAAVALESRLAALGLAEPAAASEAVTEMTGSDEQPVPSDTTPEAARTTELVETEVVVVGLVSVASIASFKRQLGRLPGVDGVSVTSGAEGEFVFRTSHEPALVLHETVPTMPGFGARVIEAGPGRIQVSARDPEADG